MFVPVSITVGAGGANRSGYNRLLELSAKFDAIGSRAGDMTAPLTRVGEDLHTQMAAAFATEGATGVSGPWTQLSETYGVWKQQHAPSVPILVGLRRTQPKGTRPQTYAASGQMMRELLMPLSDRLTWRITPKRLLYVPASKIAGFHETGTENMPARPPVDVGPTFLHSVDRTFLAWFNSLMRDAGLGGPGSG